MLNPNDAALGDHLDAELLQENQALKAQVAALQQQVQALQVQALQMKVLQRSALTWETLARPQLALALSLGATAAFVGLIYVAFKGDARAYFLLYMAPISFPFTAFLIDRLARWQQTRSWQWLLDFALVSLSLVRAFYAVPLISGHALFLAYAALSSRSWVARIGAVLVLGEVAYLKLFVWHDLTLVGGVLLGTAAAFVYRRAHAQNATLEIQI